MATCRSKKPPFINQVSGHFANNELYSDITLRFSDGTELSAHRVVLASQSGWFAQQLLDIEDQMNKDPSAATATATATASASTPPTDPPASSSSAARPGLMITLDLPTDHSHPSLLCALITYMYTRVYPSLIPPTDPTEPKAYTALRHLRLYMLATEYRIPAAQAAAARRVKDYLDELFRIQADLLTDFVPFLFGDALAPRRFERDEHGLRGWVAERVVEAGLDRVEACEVGRLVREWPGFGVEYLTAFWNRRKKQIEEETLQGFFCPSCDCSMEIVITGVKERGARKSSAISVVRSSDGGGGGGGTAVGAFDKIEGGGGESGGGGADGGGNLIKMCPNCQGPLEKQAIK
ncbi:btb poz-like protein [Diplodia corticola]|uniref:Btb poz-like protein n=1 Tax=Diplodia corticola TaxID=236234 RepID=A0A1J9RWW9_9PEZI|nr:btb poz-like protein [Diplodia corticola]OJD32340.1 btb poz-like protein [Diplodia corticola]